MARLFFSYSHKDEELRDALETHLSMLKREGLIDAMHDRRIDAGERLDDSINAYLDEADVILCLVSPDFIASEYCYSREMGRALERQSKGEAQVIPVILRHCEWQQTPLKSLRGTPRDNKPVRAWADIDEALNDVARDVRRALEAKSSPRKPAPAVQAATTEEAAIVRDRPRSSNLAIPRRVTDKDRDEYVDRAFEFLAEFFANSLDELTKRNPEVEGRVKRIDAQRFTVSAYRDGAKISAMTVFMGGAWGHGRGISYSLNDQGETKSSNGTFDIPDRGDDLYFRSIFSLSGGREIMSPDQVANTIWDTFMTPIQR